MWRSFEATYRARMILIVITALIVACAKEPVQARNWANASNALPAGVEQNADAMRKKIGQLVRAGTANRRERASTGCIAGWCTSVYATIEPMKNTNDVDPDKPPPAGQEFAVARLVNHHDSRTENYYGLKPDAEAEYYLWVTANTSGGSDWTLIEIPRRTGNVIAAKPTELKICKKRGAGETGTSETDFAENKHDGKCPDRTSATTAGVKTSSLTFLQPMFLFIQHFILVRADAADGGWIDCSNGCCT